MADIELIIRIPEEFYEGLRKVDLMFKGQRNGKTLAAVIFDAVANGTPLPKGHGDLKDMNEVEQLLDLKTPDNIIAKALKNFIENVPTIIEADKEEE